MLCKKCQGRCPLCDSYVNPEVPVLICEDCAMSGYNTKCLACGGTGVETAYYCAGCAGLGKDRDGCPVVINMGKARMDGFYSRMFSE